MSTFSGVHSLAYIFHVNDSRVKVFLPAYRQNCRIKAIQIDILLLFGECCRMISFTFYREIDLWLPIPLVKPATFPCKRFKNENLWMGGSLSKPDTLRTHTTNKVYLFAAHARLCVTESDATVVRYATLSAELGKFRVFCMVQLLPVTGKRVNHVFI